MQVTSHLGPDQLSNALYNSHLVIIPAGVPRKPGMTRDDLFNINAGKSHMKFACTEYVHSLHPFCAGIMRLARQHHRTSEAVVLSHLRSLHQQTTHPHDKCCLASAGIVKTLCEGIAKYCPKAWVAIISNPVNSTVPIAAEVFKKCVCVSFLLLP